MGQYGKPHTKRWAEKIGSFDAYIFVTPEYNHGISGALKNAIDFLCQEWNNKAAGFVSYGSPCRGAVAAGDGGVDDCRCARTGDALALHRLREHVTVQAGSEA